MTGESDPRHESPEQRDDRNLAELLQELRVAGLGVQVLFGFLLAIPFATGFRHLDTAQRDLYVTTVLLAVLATVLLLAPVAYHRIVFRQRQKEALVRSANIMAILGLIAVSLAICAAVALVISYVAGDLPAIVLTAIMGGLFASLWFAYPLARRR